MRLNRRTFIGTGLATGALLSAPAIAQAKPRVVVIGGGAGGATCARYLAKDSEGAIEVTLVETNPVYTTCFFSNLYLGDIRDFASIQHTTLSQSGFNVTCSAGLAMLDANDMSLEQWTGSAYAALAQAKADGKNCAVIYKTRKDIDIALK